MDEQQDGVGTLTREAELEILDGKIRELLFRRRQLMPEANSIRDKLRAISAQIVMVEQLRAELLGLSEPKGGE